MRRAVWKGLLVAAGVLAVILGPVAARDGGGRGGTGPGRTAWGGSWLAASARAAVQVSGGAHVSTDGAGVHAAVWVEPEAAPHVTLRFGGHYEQAGSSTFVGAEATALYHPPALPWGPSPGAAWASARPYAGAGVEAGHRSSAGGGTSTGEVYAVAGARYWLGRRWWAWAEVRYQLVRWGDQSRSQTRAVAGFGFELR